LHQYDHYNKIQLWYLRTSTLTRCFCINSLILALSQQLICRSSNADYSNLSLWLNQSLVFLLLTLIKDV